MGSGSNSYRTSVSELGGAKVGLLLILFALALYQFYHSGFTTFAIICLVPVMVMAVMAVFRFGMLTFWFLVVINYFVQMKDMALPIPISLWNESLEIILLITAIFNVKGLKFDAALNLMLVALVIWGLFCTLQLFNDTCGMAFNVAFWYGGARMMAFQLIYAFLVFSIYINTPDKLVKYLLLWGALALFAVIWIFKQQYFGFTPAESQWINTRGRSTHILQAGTLIRYFSIYSDAASAGIGMASTAAAFIIGGMTQKVKWLRYSLLTVGIASAVGMFPTGTRTAIFCLLAGFMVYTVLSRSVKMTVLFGIIGILIYFILAFTMIGNGNSSIRRMRTAFNKDDASTSVRKSNQAVMAKYLRDAPFGVGLGINGADLSPTNKFAKVASMPPDSEYVYIWIHTGIVGICIYLFVTGLMFLGASRVVMFQLTSSSLRGIGAGLTSAFVSIQLGGYGNQVLMQFPNCLAFYGGLSLVYVLPFIEDQWNEFEARQLEKQNHRKNLRLEKRRAQRV